MGTQELQQEFIGRLFSGILQDVYFISIAVALVVIGVVLWRMLRKGERSKQCPKCKKLSLKEEAFTDAVPTLGPGGRRGIYRRFYMTCTCGYWRRSRELELIIPKSK
jgi:hypothetical protein